MDLGGVSCLICDTAGLREKTEDPIEIEGIRRARFVINLPLLLLSWYQSADLLMVQRSIPNSSIKDYCV